MVLRVDMFVLKALSKRLWKSTNDLELGVRVGSTVMGPCEIRPTVAEGKQCVIEAFSLSSNMVLCLLNAPKLNISVFRHPPLLIIHYHEDEITAGKN